MHVGVVALWLRRSCLNEPSSWQSVHCMDVWKGALFNSSVCCGWQALHFANAPLEGAFGSAKNATAKTADRIMIRMYVLLPAMKKKEPPERGELGL